MVDLFWIGDHVNRAACDRVDLLPPLSATLRNHGQVGDICDGGIESIGPPLGSRKYFIAL
jgi:hypothetical protein